MPKKSAAQIVEDHHMKGLTPLAVDDVTMAFPGSIRHLMPAWDKIPEEFRDYNAHGKWNGVFSDMFYSGAKSLKFSPKEGIDTATAWRHIRCIMGSYEPKHEHKEAACAYLMSLWFEDITYEKRA